MKKTIWIPFLALTLLLTACGQATTLKQFPPFHWTLALQTQAHLLPFQETESLPRPKSAQ